MFMWSLGFQFGEAEKFHRDRHYLNSYTPPNKAQMRQDLFGPFLQVGGVWAELARLEHSCLFCSRYGPPLSIRCPRKPAKATLSLHRSAEGAVGILSVTIFQSCIQEPKAGRDLLGCSGDLVSRLRNGPYGPSYGLLWGLIW